ncbi:MAG TPA: hypothetical protein VEL06_13955 [Haliangiales bacterium]|nr:hypothetical protein [Haliangiales bacterium]
MQRHKIGPRAEYRQQENLRINASPNLAERFHELKSLKVDLAHYAAGGVHKTSEIKYTVNLANAKSVFSFTCSNNECVGGDFDLSEKLANAVAAHLTTTAGELCCQGWQSKTTIESKHCHNVLRYKLSLEY